MTTWVTVTTKNKIQQFVSPPHNNPKVASNTRIYLSFRLRNYFYYYLNLVIAETLYPFVGDRDL
ncbi:hypothetical protein T07_1596 [Trichinella nelsoni]|uniref:Uncharacterized protein n=1 Tax=Trichinella nelsoni TaxID=6336 RepID=A0A0V0RGS9_9BILA|nr:hypothetical protein T07_1596 [Trichinella nelsoni]